MGYLNSLTAGGRLLVGGTGQGEEGQQGGRGGKGEGRGGSGRGRTQTAR